MATASKLMALAEREFNQTRGKPAREKLRGSTQASTTRPGIAAGERRYV